MIESSIQKVEGGTKIAKETADALGKIVEQVENVANLVNDIAVASNEQALGIEQVNQGIMQVSQVVQANSATSEERRGRERRAFEPGCTSQTIGRSVQAEKHSFAFNVGQLRLGDICAEQGHKRSAHRQRAPQKMRVKLFSAIPSSVKY